MELSVDSNHRHEVYDIHYIYCIISTFIGVVFNYKFGKQPCIAYHSTDSEVCSLCIVTKTKYNLCQILFVLVLSS